MEDMHIPTLNPAGKRLVKLLVGSPPQSVTDLMDAVGVTRTAVCEQLNDLLSAGFVHRTTERLSGRGRPRHLYSATDASMTLWSTGNQGVVVPAIWRTIEEIGGTELKDKVVERVGRVLAKQYKHRVDGKTVAQRFRQMARLLREDEGHLVDVRRGKNGRLIMRRRSCPFYSMFEDSRTVCQLDQQVMRRVVGASVRQTACRHDGDSCCCFEITDRKR